VQHHQVLQVIAPRRLQDLTELEYTTKATSQPRGRSVQMAHDEVYKVRAKRFGCVFDTVVICGDHNAIDACYRHGRIPRTMN
jgi:hypothetical protein